jgi:glycosyltransferase involved in cell wall biosynthesis
LAIASSALAAQGESSGFCAPNVAVNLVGSECFAGGTRAAMREAMLHRNTPTKMLNVLVATPSGRDGQGGIDRIMAALGDELDRQGNTDVRVEFAASRGKGHVALSPFYLAAFMLRMTALRIVGKVDLVHINVASNGSTYRKMQIAGLARVLGIPYVLHLHGANYAEFWKGDDSALSRRIRKMFAGAARIVVLGRAWRDLVMRRAPEAADRIAIVPNAAPSPSLTHRGGGGMPHILFLGRIGDRKGVPQLGEALYRMRDLPNWRATIAGDGNVEAARAKAIELGLADRVALPGWVGPDQVAELIASADILVLPSFAENLPLSVIEGMASGLAVVATPVGAVGDIISDGETGLLVEPGDVDGLTDALRRVVTDPALREKLGRAALAFHREWLDVAPFTAAMKRVWIDASR